MLCTWNQYNTVHQLHFNKKMHLKNGLGKKDMHVQMKQTWPMLVISLYSVMGIWGFTIVLTLIYIEIFQNKPWKKFLLT